MNLVSHAIVRFIGDSLADVEIIDVKNIKEFLQDVPEPTDFTIKTVHRGRKRVKSPWVPIETFCLGCKNFFPFFKFTYL